MANEAVIIELPRNIHPVRKTVANSGTIEKGTLLGMTDPNTVAASAAAEAWGGGAAAEKVTLDGSTSLAVHLDGVFDMKCNANAGITVGQQVSLSGVNLIKTATEAEIAAGVHIGTAEETASASEVIRVRLRGY